MNRPIWRYWNKSSFFKNTRKYWVLYAMFSPIFIYYILFRYQPIIMQLILSFKDYRLMEGVWRSPWVGLGNFQLLFSRPDFLEVLRNTIEINLLRLIAGFIPPIVLAILLFDVGNKIFQRISQSLIYLPHFFSWVVVYFLFSTIFLSKTGYINSLFSFFGREEPIDFLSNPSCFRPVIVGSGLWKELGWGTIIYLAALSTIDPSLYEAAMIDGANPFQRIWYVTLPSIQFIIVFVLMLTLGGLLYGGLEQILLFLNPANMEVGDVLDTWIYREGLVSMNYSIGIAMGTFQSVVGFILVGITNWLCKKYVEVSLW